jgi:hypothetical protein
VRTHIRVETWKDSAEQAGLLGFDDSVTLANVRLQLRPVENLDMAAHVADQPIVLQTLSSMRNTFAAHSQHVRDEFLRHFQVIGLCTVVSHQ